MSDWWDKVGLVITSMALLQRRGVVYHAASGRREHGEGFFIAYTHCGRVSHEYVDGRPVKTGEFVLLENAEKLGWRPCKQCYEEIS